MTTRRRRVALAVSVTTAALALGGASALANEYGPWDAAVSVESLAGASSELNTTANDGCPIESVDGLRLYMATNRPGGLGGIDIWVAQRSDVDSAFGTPRPLGAPVNSTADDFCPTPVPGHGLFFVSARNVDGACGGADIYFTRHKKTQGWLAPTNLGCEVNGPLGEAGPSYFDADGVGHLYFSSGPDIYMSRRGADGAFGPRTPVAELNSASNDLRPNVRKDGLEIVFDSDRQGTTGGPDLWLATRASSSATWSVPVNAGPNVNTSAGETRGSFSRDGSRLYFGRSPGPEGGSDIFTSSRLRTN